MPDDVHMFLRPAERASLSIGSATNPAATGGRPEFQLDVQGKSVHIKAERAAWDLMVNNQTLDAALNDVTFRYTDNSDVEVTASPTSVQVSAASKAEGDPAALRHAIDLRYNLASRMADGQLRVSEFTVVAATAVGVLAAQYPGVAGAATSTGVIAALTITTVATVVVLCALSWNSSAFPSPQGTPVVVGLVSSLVIVYFWLCTTAAQDISWIGIMMATFGLGFDFLVYWRLELENRRKADSIISDLPTESSRHYPGSSQPTFWKPLLGKVPLYAFVAAAFALVTAGSTADIVLSATTLCDLKVVVQPEATIAPSYVHARDAQCKTNGEAASSAVEGLPPIANVRHEIVVMKPTGETFSVTLNADAQPPAKGEAWPGNLKPKP